MAVWATNWSSGEMVLVPAEVSAESLGERRATARTLRPTAGVRNRRDENMIIAGGTDGEVSFALRVAGNFFLKRSRGVAWALSGMNSYAFSLLGARGRFPHGPKIDKSVAIAGLGAAKRGAPGVVNQNYVFESKSGIALPPVSFSKTECSEAMRLLRELHSRKRS